MASASVNYLHLINQQIDYQEDLNVCLSKADALAKMALSDNFFDCPDEIKHNYLWVLSDLVNDAKTINEQAINFLFERNPHFMEPISNEH